MKVAFTGVHLGTLIMIQFKRFDPPLSSISSVMYCFFSQLMFSARLCLFGRFDFTMCDCQLARSLLIECTQSALIFELSYLFYLVFLGTLQFLGQPNFFSLYSMEEWPFLLFTTITSVVCLSEMARLSLSRSLLLSSLSNWRMLARSLGQFQLFIIQQRSPRQAPTGSLSKSPMYRLIFFYESCSLPLQNYYRQGCLSTSLMLSLFLGLNCSSPSIRSTISPGAFGNHSFRVVFFILGRVPKIDCATDELMLQISSFQGQPVNVKILYSWFIVLFPGKSGLPRAISPIMHPRLQRSTAFEQLVEPSSSQGARYHLVATYQVSTGSQPLLPSMERTRPKSQSLTLQLELRRTLEGLRSLCMSQAEWRYLTAFTIWYMMNCLCRGLSMFQRITPCKSAYMYQNTRQISLSFQARCKHLSFMIWGWLNCRKNIISLKVRWASVECWKASKIFLRARIYLVLRSWTFHTCPQAPEPSFLMSSYRLSI